MRHEKKNRHIKLPYVPFRAVLAYLVIGVFLSTGISFAKYCSQASSTDLMRAAKWQVSVDFSDCGESGAPVFSNSGDLALNDSTVSNFEGYLTRQQAYFVYAPGGTLASFEDNWIWPDLDYCENPWEANGLLGIDATDDTRYPYQHHGVRLAYFTISNHSETDVIVDISVIFDGQWPQYTYLVSSEELTNITDGGEGYHHICEYGWKAYESLDWQTYTMENAVVLGPGESFSDSLLLLMAYDPYSLSDSQFPGQDDNNLFNNPFEIAVTTAQAN